MKYLHSLIAPSIKGNDFLGAWKLFARHCANGSSKNQGVGSYHSYSPVAHDDSFRINIAVADMHRLTARILNVTNYLHNTNVPIHERVCVSPPPYYLDWFEKYYPNFPLNRYGVIYFSMNECNKGNKHIQKTMALTPWCSGHYYEIQ